MTAAAASVGRVRRAPDPQAVAVRAGALGQGAPSPRLLRHRHRAPSRALPAPRPATPHLAAPRERPVLSVFRVRKPGLSLMQFPPGLPGRGEVWAAAGGRGTKAAKAAAHSRGRLQTERPNREREPCNFRGFKRALVFPECSGRVYTVLFFFFLLKKHAQQSKVCGEID